MSGEEPEEKRQYRARAISDALGILDESTTKQVEAIIRLRAVAEAAKRLAKEVHGQYGAFEHTIREELSNSNYAAMLFMVDALDAALTAWEGE